MIMHPDVGLLNSGKCYVFLEGHGLHREPMYGTYEECLDAIEERGGVDDPIPTDGSISIVDYRAALEATKPASEPTPAVFEAPQVTRHKQGAYREYTLTFTCHQEVYCNGRMAKEGTENVLARDRNEALRRGRDIIRENSGRHGPKFTITARLAD